MQTPEPARGRLLRRRTVLTSGAAGAAALGLGLSGDTFSIPGKAAPLANQSNASVERVHSLGRNREVDLVLMYPEGVDREGLPVCLMLHGRYGDARKSAGGLPGWLSAAVAEGRVPPFAFLAVDGGGNSYWHRHPGDDPMWMLLDEVPRWLGERGLGGDDGQPFAVSGISMGGFGALLYARRRHEHDNPVTAAAVVSPALITSWREMSKRKAFVDEAEWAGMDPLRHIPELDNVALGVWCGLGDRFITGTREFIRRARPEVASTTPGGHNSRYYRKALPEVVSFIGRKLAERDA
ncbi:S-formylglutathione hydrolase FrmB [Saccharopolyspora erythraea NRRL 2338]|uniref:Acyl-CoA:diacylglycerol acyltransferase n=1 Tax=Saccharopolyspora erythraea (strain ATCC 11635 / DSM 40517 / JCM 4748 / NBRC 13426 / NCIMB 8594 / NRRL 2338) TaxID=405948 RepID=A4F9G1_SACEN|nr:alpha/beta hydrolase-fold protein [Saccharopolyspora erythraea]EQD87367.1 esterase [Saccharopolyspora erythraea D]PFG94473.1 S-formylglutathione hydrolase FrmB [Saccharopolyspora erythraea NRRL 2338]QRK91230.1 alpha/beta hydrolase [Saccharopolyspora erythraea]CAM00686.1 putative esterase [Saccharopolyspora erythraea NRRL 2338]